MLKSYIDIVQISDFHLFSDPMELHYGTNVDKNFEKILDHIHHSHLDLECLLLTGDLSQDASRQSYQRMNEAITALNINTYYLPGNHDNCEILHQTLPSKKIHNQSRVSLHPWEIILLDSTSPHKTEGYLSSLELAFLDEILHLTPNRFALIALHHHPVLTNNPEIDKYGLKNFDDFFKVLEKHKQVKAIIYGHVHFAQDSTLHGVKYLACPATSVQFKPGILQFEIDDLAPGYRWLRLHNDGTLETKIFRINS